MAPRRNLKAVPDAEEVPEEAPTEPTYEFEPITDDLQSRLNVWGNSTMLTITQIEKDYPHWANALRDMLLLLKNVAESMK